MCANGVVSWMYVNSKFCPYCAPILFRSKTSDQSPSSGDISPAPSAYDCSLRPPDDDRTQSSPAGRHRSLHWYSTRFPVQPRDTSDVRQHPSACMMAGDDKHGMPGNLHDRATESSLEPYRQPWAPLTGRERREAPQSRAYPMQTRQQRGRDVDSRIPPPHWHPSMDVPHQHPEATAMRMEASLYGRRHVSQSYGHIHDGDREWYHGSLPAAYRPYADDRNPSFSYEYYRDMLPSGSWNRERLAFGHRDEQHGPHPPYRQYLPDRGNVFGIGAHSGHAQDHSQDLGMRPAISPQYSTHSGQAVAPGETQSATAPGILGRMYLSQIRMSSAMPGPPYTNQPGSSSRNRMHMQMSLWEQGQTHERHDSPSPVNSQ